MKKIIFVLILAIAANSCKKKEAVDPCEKTNCLNGGTCNDGTCDCPSGYTGTNCETNIATKLEGAYFVTDSGYYSWSISGSTQTFPCYHSFNINRNHTSEVKVDLRYGGGGFTISNFFGDSGNVYCRINIPPNNFIVTGDDNGFITIKDGSCANGHINSKNSPLGYISNDGKIIKITLNSDEWVGNEHRVNNFASILIKQ